MKRKSDSSLQPGIRRASSGMLFDHRSSDDLPLPDGPKTLPDVYDFSRFIKQLMNADRYPAMLAGLLKNVGQLGVSLFELYAGKGTGTSVAVQLNAAMQKSGLLTQDMNTIRPIAAADKEPVCRHVLKNMTYKGDQVIKHVFGDFEDFVRVEHQWHAKRLAPKDQMSCSERLAAYQELGRYLNEAAEAGDLLVEDPHEGALCEQTGYSKSADVLSLGRSRGRIVLWVLGSNCQDFAKYGKKMGVAGPHMRSFKMFIGLTRSIRPDFIIFENDEEFPESILEDELGDMYGVVMVKMKPSISGMPAKRGRKYCWLWYKPKCRFNGTAAEFDRVFKVEVMLEGDAFLVDDGRRADMMMQMAKVQGNNFEECTHVKLEHCLTPGQLQTLSEHRNQELSKSGLGGTYITDLGQNFGWCYAGPWFPCLVTHGLLVSLSAKKLVTPMEYLFLMGEPVFPNVLGDKAEPCLFQDLLDTDALGSGALKLLSGQAMHMLNLAPFMLYGLANLEPV